jgi:hypothetical protein
LWEQQVKISSGEALSTDWMKAALAVWSQLLSIPSVKELMLGSEEVFGKRSPFDSVYKLEAILRRVASNEAAVFVVQTMIDRALNPRMGSTAMNLANLTGKHAGSRFDLSDHH